MVFEKIQIPIYIEIKPKIEITDKPDKVKPLTKASVLKENNDYFLVKDEYLHLINNFREKDTDQFIGGMPIQLQKEALGILLKQKEDTFTYGLTLKVDGIRHLMFLSKSGIIYFIDRATNIFYFRDNENIVRFKSNNSSFIFDGEMVYNNKWEFLIFDVLFYNNKSVMNQNYYKRNEIINKVLDGHLIQSMYNSSNGNILLSSKTWFSIETIKNTNDIYQYIINETNKIRTLAGNLPLNEDGIILQPFDEPYITFREWNQYNNIQFKWKPPNQLTIDFKIKIVSENVWELLTASGMNFAVKQKDGTAVNAICLPTLNDKKIYKDGDVVEFELATRNNTKDNLFITKILRPEKKEGNGLETAKSTMEVIRNPFNLDQLKFAIEILKNPSATKEDQSSILKLFSKSKVILGILETSEDLFFNEEEIKKIKVIYNEYVQKRGNKVEKIEEEFIKIRKVSNIINAEKMKIENKTPHGVVADILKSREQSFPSIISHEELKENFELEFRIFPYVKQSINKDDEKKTIKRGMYFYLLSFLFKSGFKYDYSETVDISLNDTSEKGKYRSTYNSLDLKNPKNEYKSKLNSYVLIPTFDEKESKKEKSKKKFTNDQLYNNLTMKLNLSSEKESKKSIGIKTQLHDRVVYNYIRIKKRYSFYINKYWRVDITRVTPHVGNVHSIDYKNEIFEIECEYIGNIIPFEKFIKSLSDVYILMLMNSSYI